MVPGIAAGRAVPAPALLTNAAMRGCFGGAPLPLPTPLRLPQLCAAVLATLRVGADAAALPFCVGTDLRAALNGADAVDCCEGCEESGGCRGCLAGTATGPEAPRPEPAQRVLNWRTCLLCFRRQGCESVQAEQQARCKRHRSVQVARTPCTIDRLGSPCIKCATEKPGSKRT